MNFAKVVSTVLAVSIVGMLCPTPAEAQTSNLRTCLDAATAARRTTQSNCGTWTQHITTGVGCAAVGAIVGSFFGGPVGAGILGGAAGIGCGLVAVWRDHQCMKQAERDYDTDANLCYSLYG